MEAHIHPFPSHAADFRDTVSATIMTIQTHPTATPTTARHAQPPENNECYQNISENPSTPRRTSYQHLRTHLPLDLKNGQAGLLRACYRSTFRLYCPHHSPLKVYRHGVPIGRFSHPVLDLWRAYFGFSYEVDGRSSKKHSKTGKTSHRRNAHGKGRRRRNAPSKGQRKRRRQDAAAKSYMIAQMPHGIMVRRWDWLLCYPFAATQSESVYRI